jgi:hypothetical protein
VATNVSQQLLLHAIQQCADRIDGPTEHLPATVELMQRSACANDAQAQRLWDLAQRLADQTRANLKDAAAWLQATSENRSLDQTLDQPHLRGALSALRRSVDRTSALLGRSDILIATAGPRTKFTEA